MRALVRGGVLLLGAALGIVLVARPADAHARLVRSEPANGAMLAQAPRVATLWFDEDIARRLSSVRLIDIRGAAVNGARTEKAGGPEQLKVRLPGLAPGTYGLAWRALAENDGHATNGIVVFTVGAAAPARIVSVDETLADGGSAGTTAAPGEVLLRWVGLCLLAGIVGGLTVAGPILGRTLIAGGPALSAGVRRARRRLLTVTIGCAALAAGVGVVSFLAESRRVSTGTQRSPIQTIQDLLSGPRWGQVWLASESALVILVGLVFALRSRLDQRRTWRGSAAAGGVVLLVFAIVWLRAVSSHAAAVESSRTPAVLADAAHILTALFWLGALPALVLVFWPRDATVSRPELVNAIRRPFTGFVLLSATILLATGLYGAGREVPELNQLVGTSYGRTLVVKTALLAILGSLGLANSVLLHGRIPAPLGRRLGLPTGGAVFRRLVLVEAGAGAILLVAAGFLADTAPPRPTAGESPPATAAEPASMGGTVSDLTVSVTAGPNRPGVNGFTVLVASSRRPPPAPVTSVTLTFKDPGRVPTDVGLREIEPGRYFGAGQFNHPGPVSITATIRRGGQVLPVAFIWTVESDAAPAPLAQPRPTPRPLAPYVNGLAVCLLALALIVGIWQVSRRRRARSVDIAVPDRVKILEDVR